MAIAPTVAKYLAAKNVKYDVLQHERTPSSGRAAAASQTPAASSRTNHPGSPPWPLGGSPREIVTQPAVAAAQAMAGTQGHASVGSKGNGNKQMRLAAVPGPTGAMPIPATVAKPRLTGFLMRSRGEDRFSLPSPAARSWPCASSSIR